MNILLLFFFFLVYYKHKTKSLGYEYMIDQINDLFHSAEKISTKSKVYKEPISPPHYLVIRVRVAPIRYM